MKRGSVYAWVCNLVLGDRFIATAASPHQTGGESDGQGKMCTKPPTTNIFDRPLQAQLLNQMYEDQNLESTALTELETPLTIQSLHVHTYVRGRSGSGT
jgi:hypothetical protein